MWGDNDVLESLFVDWLKILVVGLSENFVHLVCCLGFFLTKDVVVGKKLVEYISFPFTVENEEVLIQFFNKIMMYFEFCSRDNVRV